jgi:endoribonuclease L-PSP
MDDGRKRAINPKEVAPPLKGHYSNSVKVTAGPLLFIAGQISIEAQGRLVGAGDLCAQATQVLENIRAILRANGGDGRCRQRHRLCHRHQRFPQHRGYTPPIFSQRWPGKRNSGSFQSCASRTHDRDRSCRSRTVNLVAHARRGKASRAGEGVYSQ